MRSPIYWVLWVLRHLEALGELIIARIELLARGWDRTLEAARRRQGISGNRQKYCEHTLRAVERSLWRTSRLVPGVTCIHRALSAQRMMARRGFSAKVVIGLRRGPQQVEGHAWIEVGSLKAFVDDAHLFTVLPTG